MSRSFGCIGALQKPDNNGKERKDTMDKKGSVKKNVLHVGIAVILLLLVMAAAVPLGIFNGIGGFWSMIPITLDMVVRLLFAIAFMVILTNLILLLLKKFKTKSGRLSTLSTVMISLIKYASVLLGFCWCLTIIGVNVSTIFASLGIIALILGFGAETLIADLVTGVFILFENQYNVGDIIEVDGFRGTVTEIGIRTISIMDGGGNVKIINNSNMKNIVNRSDQQSVAVTDISVSYGEDLEELEKKLPAILDGIYQNHKDVFEKEVIYLGVEQLSDSSVVLRFKADVKEENIFSGRRILNRELKIAFDRENIEIPFPQVDIHNR